MVTLDGAPQTWIRKNVDADGYFLLQLVKSKELKLEYSNRLRDMFLTADNASSLTIEGTTTVVCICKKESF